MNPHADHPPFETLLAWWLQETDDEATARVDEHLMRCDACGDTVDAIAALGSGVREAFRSGAVAAAATSAFVDDLIADGVRVREYRLSPQGSVRCGVERDDEVLLTRLEAPLAGVGRVDLLEELSIGGVVRRSELHDVPFDAAAGEVVLIPPLARLHAMPSHRLQITLVAVDDVGARRELGRYTFDHRATDDGGAATV